MKKTFLLLFSLFMLTAVQFSGFAQDDDNYMPAPGYLPEDFDYKKPYLDENGWLLWLPNPKKDLVIPAEIDGKPVKGIGNGFIDGGFLTDSLESVTIPASVVKVEYVAFFMANKLKKINFSEGIKALGQQSFAMAGELTEVVLPKSLEYLGGQVFLACPKLTKVTIGPKIKTISTVFMSCDKLVDYVIDKDNPYIKFENNALFSKDGKVLQLFPQAQKIKEYTIPRGCEKISSSAFSHSPLEKVVISENVKNIGHLAFVYSGALKYVDIMNPDRVNFEKGAFAQTNLDIMIIRSLEPPTFQPTSFGGTSEDDLGQKKCILYVPDEAWDAYNNSELPKYFKDMKKISELPVTANQNVELANNLKVVNGTLYYRIAKPVTINIYSITGKLVFSVEAHNLQGSVDLGNAVQAPGMYIISVGKKSIKVVL